MSEKWSISIGEGAGNVARVVFAPEGVDVGATFAVRDPSFTSVDVPASGSVSVCGGKVSVTVKEDGKTPHKDNLAIEWTSGGKKRSWRPGDLDHENLGAPFLALDNLWRDYIPRGVRPADPMIGFDRYIWDTITLTWELESTVNKVKGAYPKTEDRNDEVRRLIAGEKPQLLPEWPENVLAAYERVKHSPPGLLSRSGLCLFRDDTPPWDQKEEWIKPRPEVEPYVFYLVYHDCDWKSAVADLSGLLGPIPEVPPIFMGVWYSNYAELGQRDFEKIVAQFAEHKLPLDIVSIDMDWHGKDWYGYEWNKPLFPDPDGLAAWLKREGLKGTFNVHPLYVHEKDSRLQQFIEESGHSGKMFDESGDWHPLQKHCLGVDIHDKRQAQVYFDMLHRPIEKGGCDFWWIDGSVRRPDGGDECSWLNHAYRAHLQKQEGQIPIVLARAGGLGSHRDAILFTGDTCVQWEVLAFEVETTVRAAGALMAYVSHDIGGFYNDVADFAENKPSDELYTRWVQFGCLSAIMRLHSFDGVREPWRFSEETCQIARRFMNLRMRLLPYTSELITEAHRTGVTPVRPMWFEFGDEEAYECLGQFMLGSSLLVVPVAKEDATVRYWLPAGKWFDAFSDRVEVGPKWVEELVSIETIPLWLREGAEIELGEATPRVAKTLAGPRHKVSGGGWA